MTESHGEHPVLEEGVDGGGLSAASAAEEDGLEVAAARHLQDRRELLSVAAKPFICGFWHGALELVRRMFKNVGTPVDQDVEFPEGVLDLLNSSRVHRPFLRGGVKPRKGSQLTGLHCARLGKAVSRSRVE